MQAPAGWRLLFWLGIALLAHVLVALFGVLNRWLQVDPTPPLPPLRLALLVSMLGLASVCAIDLSGRGSHWAGQKRTRRRGLPAAQQPSKQQQQQQQCEQHFEAADGSQKSLGDSSAAQAALEGGTAAAPALASADSFGSGEEGIAAAAAAALADRAAAADGSNGSRDKEAAQQPAAVTEAAAAPTAVAAAAPGQPVPSYYLAQQQAASFVRSGSSVGYLPGDPLPPRPELALMRGLSRRVRSLSAGRPRLVRLGFLSLITVSFASACLCQIVAPGFIDPSIVQLINMFAVLGVALVQSLLLHHHLPVVIWPSMLVMLGGAAMVIVPSINDSESGGINGWRGWLGFGLALCSMVCTVIYFVALQASRRLGFTSMQLQFLYLVFSIVVTLPLTLAVDGTDWSAQFDGWLAGDWAVLVATGSVVTIAANYCIQHSMWQLGAPLVSMFYGLRLVAAIVESQLILGTTVIKTGLQIAGTVVTVVAVTFYMFWTWRASRAQQAATAAVTPAADGQSALAGDGQPAPVEVRVTVERCTA